MQPYFYHLAFQLLSHSPAGKEEPLTRPIPIADCLEILRLERGSFKPISRESLTPPSKDRKLHQARTNSGHSHEATLETQHAKTIFQEPLQPDLVEKSCLISQDKDLNTADFTKDWRFGKVEVDSIDMDHVSADARHERDLASFGAAIRGKYVATSAKTSEVGWGVVHLFRDAQPASDNTFQRLGSTDDKEESEFMDKECTTLCILAVPSYMTPSDLLGWLGEQTREEVSHLRLVRTGRANRYMVLMKFRDASVCKNWQREWNGKLFSSMEVRDALVIMFDAAIV